MRFYLVGLVAVAVPWTAYFMTPERVVAQPAPDPYKIEAYSFPTVRVIPWTDPETECRYLITTTGSSNGGASMILRADRFGNNACPRGTK